MVLIHFFLFFPQQAYFSTAITSGIEFSVINQ